MELLLESIHSLPGMIPLSGLTPQLLDSLCWTTWAEILTCREGFRGVGLVWAGAVSAAKSRSRLLKPAKKIQMEDDHSLTVGGVTVSQPDASYFIHCKGDYVS